MKSKDLVSIIIPFYNAEKYLKRCISSIVRQSFKNLEILCINDGSNDKSCEVVKEFEEDIRVKLINKIRGGVSSARNLGLDIASGNCIMFVDADDEIESDAVEYLLNAMKKKRVDIVTESVGDGSLIWQGKDALENSLKDHPATWACWGKLYTKSIIGDTRFEEALKQNEDSFFVFNLCCKNPQFMICDKKIYTYFQNSDSSSHSKFSEKYFDILKVAEKKKQIICVVAPEFNLLAENVVIKAKLNFLQILMTRTDNEYLDLEKQLIQEIKKDKQYYISVTASHDKWMKIVCSNMYFLWKKALKLKEMIGK